MYYVINIIIIIYFQKCGLDVWLFYLSKCGLGYMGSKVGIRKFNISKLIYFEEKTDSI